MTSAQAGAKASFLQGAAERCRVDGLAGGDGMHTECQRIVANCHITQARTINPG
jgi:hypothetical protein